MKRSFLLTTAISLMLLSPGTAQERASGDQELIKQLTIDNIDVMHGLTFEIYVCKLLEQRGYKTQNLRASNDFGTDIIATKDKDTYSIQVKRSKNPIDRKAISDAVAGMVYYKCGKSMVVTNSKFTKSAQQFAATTSCILIGRRELITWITTYRQTANNKAPQASPRPIAGR